MFFIQIKSRLTTMHVSTAFADNRQKIMLARKCRRKAKCRSQKCGEYITFFEHSNLRTNVVFAHQTKTQVNLKQYTFITTVIKVD